MFLAFVDWTNVLVALIAAVPASIAAYAGLSNRRALQTPSGTSVGKQIENVHHVSLGNNYRLRSLAGEMGGTPPASAQREETKVDTLEPDGGSSE